MPPPVSCNSEAASTLSELDERRRSSPSQSICATKNPDCRLQSDQQNGSLEALTAPNTAGLSPIPITDAYVSWLLSDCNIEPTVSTRMTAFGVNVHARSAPESEVRQELLQSPDRSISLLKAVDQDVPSAWTDSRDEDRQSNIESTHGSRKRSRALSEDKEDRCTVKRIVDHDEYAGRKRYLIKWGR